MPSDCCQCCRRFRAELDGLHDEVNALTLQLLVLLETRYSTAEAVAATIRVRIRLGAYPPGSSLPSQRELAEAFKCAQGTIAAAMAQLRHEGYVEDPGPGHRLRVVTLNSGWKGKP